MAYHAFRDEDGNEYGSFETFWHDAADLSDDEQAERMPTGWYWWACFPGCMPDGEPNGPFGSEAEAIEDAQEGGR